MADTKVANKGTQTSVKGSTGKAQKGLSAEEKAALEAESPCLATAATRAGYQAGLEGAGFTEVSIDATREVAQGFSSAIVRAAKPA